MTTINQSLKCHPNKYAINLNYELEITHRVQTNADDFHVLFLVVCENHNSKKNPFKKFWTRILIQIATKI